MMVKNQIEARGIKDTRVLDALRRVERHKFVPTHYRDASYDDHPLPIGHGQTISQPYIVALMTELCQLQGTERVLEIGTGSGYQAAVLSMLAKEVYSIELIDDLASNARDLLKQLGCGNVAIRCGDGYAGWPDKAPFDVIILTASPPSVPQTLIDQLADNGILVTPVGDVSQELITITKKHGDIIKNTITYVRFVPMIKPGDHKKN
jgi:protein-L-isoaspartate(D-aspartate) O-methyltransferase